MDYARHLLIDAYNVIYQLPDLRRLLKKGTAAAREALGTRVQVLHDHERIRVTLVFDGKGDEISVERPGELTTFSYVYSTCSLSADDVIEQIVGGTKDPANCTVVTNDLAERHTIEALGATSLSPNDLEAWIAATEDAMVSKIKTRQKTINSVWRNRLEF